MTDETPEDIFQRWLRENPPPPRVAPKLGLTDRLLTVGALLASAVLWSGIAYAIFRHLLR